MRRSTLALIVLPIAQAASQPNPPLWGSLDRGPFQVGFRQLLLRDPTRSELPGARERSIGVPGRQIQLLLWYPAQSGGTPMQYGDYVALLAQAFDFSPLTSDRRAAAVAAFRERAIGLGGDTGSLNARLPVLLRARVAARRDAFPAARRRFPVVIYPEWRAPASNSVLAEYLASHGFVVAATGLRGTDDEDVEFFAVRGIEAMRDDLAFVLAALDTIPFANTRSVATMGVGIAATAALALQMRSPAVRAFVSLEGGVTTEGEQRLLARLPAFDVARIDVPMLAITAPHPSVDARRLDLYRYSRRHLVHFPAMGEFWFLDYGMIEPMIPRVIGAAPGNTVAASEWAYRIVEHFFAATLRGDSLAAQRIDGLRPPPDAPRLFDVTTRPAAPRPLKLAEAKSMLGSGGIAALTGFVNARLAADSQPIPNEYFPNLSAWLADGRDATGRQRFELTQLRVRLYPRSTRAHSSHAANALRVTDSTTARHHISEALRLLADDQDPHLEQSARAAVHRLARSLGVTISTP
jgi:hypothetical protein